ncbi:uncharacterized protein LOC143302239 [Babylonia areolata]|uniref:uncharacterized protein LOC143302239 n=1 Tax=Babylonia areolata TaxID=304850 RepID=UPI003FCF4C1A
MSTTSNSNTKPLRIMTYMSPDVAIELFEVVRDYLEEKLGITAYLMVESRTTGPPEGRPDPLTSNDADMLFISSTSYLEQRDKNKYLELCKVAPVHKNFRGLDEPVCFSDIVVLSNKVTQNVYKDFESLKGCRWAYSTSTSGTGASVMLKELKKHGFNANFFGSSCESGSHRKSIKLVLSGQVDVASVNSVALASFKTENPQLADHLTVIKSLGPLPMYAAVFNTRLPSDMKDAITKALLEVSSQDNQKWADEFSAWGVIRFAPNSDDHYQVEGNIAHEVRQMSTVPAYY